MAYSAAYTITKEQRYKDVVDDIMLYISRDMTHPSGGSLLPRMRTPILWTTRRRRRRAPSVCGPGRRC